TLPGERQLRGRAGPAPLAVRAPPRAVCRAARRTRRGRALRRLRSGARPTLPTAASHTIFFVGGFAHCCWRKVADLLIVDDDSDLGDLLGEAVVDEGHQVRIARNGREGLRLVAERSPDLVLLDVEMPVLDGPDMAYQLFLRNCGAEKIPIVLVSGNVDLPRSAA